MTLRYYLILKQIVGNSFHYIHIVHSLLFYSYPIRTERVIVKVTRKSRRGIISAKGNSCNGLCILYLLSIKNMISWKLLLRFYIP